MSGININQFSESLNDKADRDLGNLSSLEGENHFINPTLTNSSYTTNRILEIPQDIKLELSNGTLTLKAGSKTYWCDGSFTPVTTTQDVTVPAITYTYPEGTLFYVWYLDTNLQATPVTSVSSGAGTTGSSTWNFNTTDNKLYGNGTYYKRTLPVCIIVVSGTAITAIDQVFNGFGYIGSTIFVLPDIKAQYANGRNTDGTCKSIIATTTEVCTYTPSYGSTNYYNIGVWLRSGGTFTTSDKFYYDSDKNQIIYKPYNTVHTNICIAEFDWIDGKVTSWRHHIVDSILNSNLSNLTSAGSSRIAQLSKPSSRVVTFTVGAYGSTYTSPGVGRFVFKATKTDDQLGTNSLFLQNQINTSYPLQMTTCSQVSQIILSTSVPCKSGDTIRIGYVNCTPTQLYFMYDDC